MNVNICLLLLAEPLISFATSLSKGHNSSRCISLEIYEKLESINACLSEGIFLAIKNSFIWFTI
jgi:hypothetical protein